MGKVKLTKQEIEENKKLLLDLLRDADSTIYYHIDRVSASGMSRRIIFYLAPKAGTIFDISFYVASIIDYTMPKRGYGITVTGAGMDMGYYVVSSLAKELNIEISARNI